MFGKNYEKKRLEKERETLTQYRDILNQAVGASIYKDRARSIGFIRPLGTDESRINAAYCRPENDLHITRMLGEEGFIRLTYGFDRVLSLFIHAEIDVEDYRRSEIIEIFHDNKIDFLSDANDNDDDECYGPNTVLLRTYPASNAFDIEYGYTDVGPDEIKELAIELLEDFVNSMMSFYDDNEDLLEDDEDYDSEDDYDDEE